MFTTDNSAHGGGEDGGFSSGGVEAGADAGEADGGVAGSGAELLLYYYLFIMICVVDYLCYLFVCPTRMKETKFGR